MSCVITRNQAFTLIELLIVVAIIAILVAIAVPNFLEAQTRAKVATAKSDIRALVSATETCFLDENSYPNGAGSTEYPNPGNEEEAADLTKLTTPIAYMTSLPAHTPFGPWRTEWFPDERSNGYGYVGGVLLKEWLRMGGYVLPSEFTDATEYFWWGVGPTNVFSASLSEHVMIPYDPTNGTVSVGDILYVAGPAAQTGWHSFK